MHKRAKGNKGEDVACKFIEKNGFEIIDRNYQKKWGELDIVATKNGVINFFEVKSVTVDFSLNSNSHKPEDNIDGWKVKHLRRIIESYLEEKGGGLGVEFSFHVICVFLDMNTRRARVKWIKNLIL
ncbi:MAG: YraN family protein [Patescibacteria group bacterium]